MRSIASHGPVIDLATDPVNAKIASEVRHSLSEPISDCDLTRFRSVLPRRKGHGCRLPRTCVRLSFFRNTSLRLTRFNSALVGATDADGKSIFAGRRVNAFTNAEGSPILVVFD